MNMKPGTPYSPIWIGLLLIGFLACTRPPYSSSNKEYRQKVNALTAEMRITPLTDSISLSTAWIGTTNFDLRRPNFVIIHNTAQAGCDLTLKTFTTDQSKVSAHYVICKDGSIHHMLNDYLRAWQAGISRWGNASDINSSSIGIELDNDGFEPFAPAQINSLIALLAVLKKKFSIPTPNFIGHADVAPGRKVDPNRFFPWDSLAVQGFGLWYDTTGVVLPCPFDTLQALRIIGYDVRNPEAAIQSFKIHFVPQDSSKYLDSPEEKILFDLSRKFQ
jgi:N-acetylmuramoyl-L-alanine amidase